LDSLNNKIWAAGSKGVFYSSKEKTDFKSIEELVPSLKDIDVKHAQDIVLDQDNKLWFANSSNGLFNIKLSTLTYSQFTFVHSNQKKSSRLNSVISISQDPSDSTILWLGTLEGLIKFDTNTHEYSVHVYQNIPENAQNRIRKTYVNTTHVYFGTWGEGLIAFDKKSKTFHQVLKKEYPNSHKLILTIKKKSEDQLWITTGHGLIVYDTKSKNIVTTKNNQLQKGILKGITHIDSRGIIWYGHSKGMFKYDPKSAKNKFITLEERNYLQSSMNVNSIIDRDGFWYVLGYNSSGLYKIDQVDNSYEVIKIPQFTYTENDGYGMVDMIEMEDGKILMISHKTILIFDPTTNIIKRSPLQLPNENPVMRTVVRDYQNRYWIGTRIMGLYCLDYENMSIRNYKHEFDEYKEGNHIWIEHIYADSSKRLWIRTASEMSVMNLENLSIHNYKKEEVYYNIGGFYEDQDRKIWVTGHDEGMGYLDPENKKILHQVDGLQYRVYPYKDSLAWTVSRGLGILNTHNASHEKLSIENGDEQIIVRGPVLKKDDHTYIIGCDNGVLLYDTSKPIENIPVPYIRNIIVDSTEVYRAFNIENKTFHFPSTTKYVEMNISALEFRAMKNVQYQYNLNDTWITIGKNKKIRFNNLPSGKYSLKIRTYYDQNLQETAPITYHFKIETPWYYTWWAYGLYLITFIVFTIYISIKRFSKLENEKIVLEETVAIRSAEILSKNKQLENQAKELQKMDQMKSRFFANISHEFRTPITLVNGPIKDALRNNNESISLHTLTMMSRNTDRLLRLVNQLLDLSKLDAGKMGVDHQEGDINGFLTIIASSFISHSEDKKIAYEIDVAKHILSCFFDLEKLEKILYNLLSNAFKYVNDTGTIKFQASVEEKFVTIQVSNTGKEISEEHLPYIFDRFYRGEDSMVQDQEGTGIGLSLTKELVNLLNGEIKVESTAIDGTIFTVIVPITRVSRKKSHPKKVSGIATNNQQFSVNTIENEQFDERNDRLIVLIVEDNQDMRKYIKSGLSSRFKVLEAQNGNEGLAIAIQEIPDLIITDLMMPKMDGMLLSEKLRSDKKTSHIPIIMLTARAEKEMKIKGLLEGIDHYLTKPFDSIELKALVNNLISQRIRLRKLYSEQITLEPKQVTVSSLDQMFLDSLINCIEANLSDSDFGVTGLIKELGMSRTQLHRKIKALTDQSTGEFLRNYRLKRASQILEQQGENISQIAFMVGFNDPSYFSKCYRKLYGKSPKDVLKN